VLDAVRGPVSLSGTGMLDADVEALEHALSRAHGAVLVTGPTGSGKTTTLYGALSILHTGARSILTIEDPVEYEIPGIKQMQVNPRAGLQFATGLRSLMRADPDVIMVGEVRDRETAQITIEAALTGHLVLTTLHTNDAASTPVRLIEMGVAPFLVASAVTCVVAQRLVRRLCPACRREAIVPAEIMRGQGFAVDADARVWEPVGCDLCGHTGYRGRIGVFEVLQMTDEVRRCVLARKHASEVREAATAAGTRTLRDDGLEKVMHGETTLTEILRVAG
jgi:type IV pilus assembly protein PilB